MPESIRPAALVTGATGFIGSHLARRLLNSGLPVRLLVRSRERLAADLAAACSVVEGALDDEAALDAALDGAGTVFHCAANVRTWDTPKNYWHANVDGVHSLMAAIARRPGPRVRLVHLSTVDVYGFPLKPANEEQVSRPGSFGYGASKQAGELVLREACALEGVPFTLIRPCNVIGPGSPFVERIGAELSSGLMLRVDGGRAHAGLLHVDTLVQTLIWAARNDRAIGQIYNVREVWDASWADFLRELRVRIDGRGVLLDLPFVLADTVAHVLANTQGRLFPNREPLLHPLLVRIFGRTCGHDITRLRAAGGLGAGTEFSRMMDEAAEDFLAKRAQGRHVA